jgi:predicted DNA binding CopG/RHH family protein
MSKNRDTVEYTDEPVQFGKRVPDFLPPPEELAKADALVKVTIALSAESIDFFKQQAKTHNTSYQRMIRRLLDEYAQRYQQPA